MRYVVRERTLPAHIRPGRPTVYDVTEAHTTRAVPHGVHTCPDRAAAHAERLIRKAAMTRMASDQVDAFERVRDRARIAANRDQAQGEEKPKPRPRRARRKPTTLTPRTKAWDGTLPDAADIITRIHATGGAAAYTCADPLACWRASGHSPHTIRVTAPAAAVLLPGDKPPQTARR
ncbi:hypothetical protein [Nocardiopsis synnemataformans]|uniref:hypothetical protein n=1 Tax=Nocardiopsis synnemataformans TaxID=61305 RepID=UPI003EBBCC1F